MAAPNTEPYYLVYVGMRQRDGRLVPYWGVLTEEEAEDCTIAETKSYDNIEYVVYASKNSRKYLTGGIGAVYQVPKVIGDTSIYPVDATYMGLWKDDERRLVWQAEHRANTTAYDLSRKAKKEGKEDDFAALKPLQNKYRKLANRNQQAAFLAQIIVYITG